MDKLIQELLDSGMTETALAKALNCSQPTINRFKRGLTQPSYDVGVKIKEMHARMKRRKPKALAHNRATR